MHTSAVRIEEQGHICTIVLDRLGKKNAVDRPTAEALYAAFEHFETDPNLRVAVLWGANGTFCSGADLTAMHDPIIRNSIDPEGESDGPMGPTRMALRKPVIAAVSGYAVAGGQSRALDMILTGRPVKADEALLMGLANRVVPDGESREAAEALARQIAEFPQQCMLADRASAYRQWELPLAEALRNEGKKGYPIVFKEAIAGAGRFADGAGRHGQFDN